jgi:hypothetical protein
MEKINDDMQINKIVSKLLLLENLFNLELQEKIELKESKKIFKIEKIIGRKRNLSQNNINS